MRNSPLLDLPTVAEGLHLIDIMSEIGWYVIGGMGSPQALGWVDIKAWADLTNTRLEASDYILIRDLSKAYVGQYFASSDPSEPAPYQSESALANEAVGQQLLDWARTVQEGMKKPR